MSNLDFFINYTTRPIYVFSSFSYALPLIPALYLFSDGEKLKARRVCALFAVAFLSVSLFTLFSQGVLGESMFDGLLPIHTLAVIGEFSVARRLDVVVNLVVLSIGAIKISVYGSAISSIIGKKLFVVSMFVILFLSFTIGLFTQEYLNIFLSVVAFLTLAFIFIRKSAKKAMLFLFIPIIMLSSCAVKPGGTELKERTAVTMTFIDKTDIGYEIALLVITSYEETRVNTSYVTAEGESLSSALYDISQTLGGELFFGQNDTLILGKSLSEIGIGDILQDVIDTKIMTPAVSVFLSEYESDELSENEDDLFDKIKSLEQQSSDNRIFTKQLHEISKNSIGDVEDVLPVINLFDNESISTDEAMIIFADKLAHKMTKEQMLLYLSLQGKRERIAVVFEEQGTQEVRELYDFAVKYSEENEDIHVTISAKIRGDIHNEDILSLENTLAGTVHELLGLSDLTGVDFLGFANRFDVSLIEIDEYFVKVSVEK